MLSTIFRPIFFLKFKCIQKQKLSGFGIPLHNLYRFINLPVSVPSLISLPFEVITKHQEACEMASRPSPLFSEVCCATLSCQFIAAQNQHSNRSTTTFQQLRYTLSLHRLKDCAGNETSFTITLLSSYCYANERKKGQSVLRWKGDSEQTARQRSVPHGPWELPIRNQEAQASDGFKNVGSIQNYLSLGCSTKWKCLVILL